MKAYMMKVLSLGLDGGHIYRVLSATQEWHQKISRKLPIYYKKLIIENLIKEREGDSKMYKRRDA